MAAPHFKIGEVVYLVESAALGELEAYKIGALKQTSPDVWVYQIFIEQKPPTEQTVGDRIDLKESRDLFYEESELFTLCEAIQTAINNVEIRINRTQFMIDECNGVQGGTYIDPIPVPQPNPGPNEPRYNIKDTVYVKASANIGFLEDYQVTGIMKQPSNREYMYSLSLTTLKLSPGLTLSGKPRFKENIYFKERELITKCEALDLAVASLDRKMSRLLALRISLCGGTD